MKRYMPECNYEEDGLESYTLTECAQGPVCEYEEAAALITEKDEEIGQLLREIKAEIKQQADYKEQLRASDEATLRLLGTIKYLTGIAIKGERREPRDDETVECFVLDYVKRIESELRASNEALVAAQARIEFLNRLLEHAGLIATGDNLTALASHDKEVRAKALEEVRSIISSYGNLNSVFVPALIRRINELQQITTSSRRDPTRASLHNASTSVGHDAR